MSLLIILLCVKKAFQLLNNSFNNLIHYIIFIYRRRLRVPLLRFTRRLDLAVLLLRVRVRLLVRVRRLLPPVKEYIYIIYC
tara:strand:+ start:680 stop:922 length:243 start_codon:yes stop_codon:yes gene_type:complete